MCTPARCETCGKSAQTGWGMHAALRCVCDDLAPEERWA